MQYKAITLAFTVDGECLITDISLKCTRRKCDDCVLRFQCLTTKMDNDDETGICINIFEALKLFEGVDHQYIVWRNSKCKRVEGEFKTEAKLWLNDYYGKENIKKGRIKLPI